MIHFYFYILINSMFVFHFPMMIYLLYLYNQIDLMYVFYF